MKAKVINYSLFIILLGFFLLKTSNFTYEEDKWKHADYSEKYYMSKDIIKRKLFIHKTKEEIISLLGKPKFESDTKITYKVDQPMGYKDFLSIQFKDKKVDVIYIHD